MAKPKDEDKSFFSQNKDLTEAIVGLHRWLAAHQCAVTRLDLDQALCKLKDELIDAAVCNLERELNKTEDRLVKAIGERVDPARIQKLTNDLKSNAQALEQAVEENKPE